MARIRSVDFLPEIFQTDANKQFLAATLDQLVQEPKFKKTQGYIGRRLGPGITPGDNYVTEPDATRRNYQLEPGVISLKPTDTTTVQDAITYPGILDALGYQGANSSRPDRLFRSDYYAWDSFVDFDTFVNFSQYYWVPNGPDPVTVYASNTSLTQDFVVTRANSTYTFSNESGTNPTLTLVRGGNYTFQVSNNNKETVTLRVTNNGTASYSINYEANPTLTLVRGNTYVFTLNFVAEYPFWIKNQPTTGVGNAYNNGVTNNGARAGNVIFTVPVDAPDTLYYAAQNNVNMQGQFNIVTATDTTGPGFWIQTAPGATGRNPVSPNISTRGVLGVTNNGINQGIVSFNVPSKTAQSFYYNLTSYGGIDLITDLSFSQIDGVKVNDFLTQYGGIDGIANLAGLTLIFNNSVPPEDEYVWQIEYVDIAGELYISLTVYNELLTLNKFQVLYGTEYANTQWYKDQSGRIQAIPLLSAVQDTLYYQDSANPNIFGQIKLVEPTANSVLDITEIIGRPNYTSPAVPEYPQGVEFTNGLKVRFTGDVYPQSYWSGTVTVNCRATVESINSINCDNTQGLVRGQQITFSGPVIGGIVAGTVYYVDQVLTDNQFSITTVRGGPSLPLTSEILPTGTTMTAVASADKQYYVAGVGTAIKLLPVENFGVYEAYATDANTETVYIEPSAQDYITIDRNSPDYNAWSRSNRWFHVDVLTATGTYNKTPVNLDNNNRARRPIIQFRGGIRLYNMGTEGKFPVDTIDFDQIDALSNVEGTTSYTVNGYTLVNGSRIIFAADSDPDVRRKIYVVNFITPDSAPTDTAENLQFGLHYVISELGDTNWNTVAGTTGVTYQVGDEIIVAVPGAGTGTATVNEPLINLIPADDAEILTDDTTVVTQGTQVGTSYWFDGTQWIEAQQKISTQQPPLFNVYDANNISFGDRSVYPSSTFTGSKLFSYAVGVGTIDPVLQFKLQYLTLENVGDIVFDNNLYKDTFVYVTNAVSQTGYVSSGYPREYADRTNYTRLLGWQTAATPVLVPQQFQFTYNRQPFQLDVAALTDQETVVPAIKVFVSGLFMNPSTYSVTRTATTTTVSLNDSHVIGETVEIIVLSNQISKTGFYQVPSNLSQNPINANSNYFTLGTIRSHYETICQNLTGLQGPINGANNTRDLGNIVPYGQLILQQSSPLTMAGYFMRSTQYNVFAAMEYNSREYQKFKNQLLDATTKQNISYNIPISELLDTVIADLIVGRNDNNPFYWTDMLPAGQVYQTNSYTVSYTSTPTFPTLYIYNYTSANYQGMNVYVTPAADQTQRILTRGLNYVVNVDSASITLTQDTFNSLNVGDVITIQEYQDTYGTFVPNTPTKMGLYPAWEPGIVPVKTTNGHALVILGHDGSQTPAFGDIRDQVLLEFETRIYNNLKLDGNPVPLTVADVLPGQFRKTDYTYTEITDILNDSFLSYVGWNKLDYSTQDYNGANPYSFNYSQSQNKLNNQPLLGAWRGIYRYFYDTQQPEFTPWEMLGFSVKPQWWEDEYGPAPYTADNLVLWDDLEAGLVRDPAGAYVVPAYVRPGLTKVIPVDSEGTLLPPLDSVVGQYVGNTFQKSWAPGDGSPVEASWWNSSDYPFAVMRLLALTRSAEFFALFADRDLYRYQSEFDQYLYSDRYRLTTRANTNQPEQTNVQVYGNGVSKASYINWIVDYNKVLGKNSTQDLQDDLTNIDVRLCYRMASFSDKQYIKLYTEKSSPVSTNTALLIPDESYDLLLYKNQPFDRSVYSSVVVQVTADGWSVFGYGQYRPYFETLTSVPAGQYKTFSVGPTTVQVPTFYSDTITQVPYGYTFTTPSAVANFLLSYGKLLEKEGYLFDDKDNGYILSWDQMVQEFLYWANQGWGVGTLLNLNPLAYKLSIARAQAVVDSVTAQTAEHVLLDQNGQELPVRNLNITRNENVFTVQPLTGQVLSFVDLRFTSYESMIVLNNASLFGDLIYEPITGARQNRLKLVAATTTEWNGSVDAQGFVINQGTIEEWTGLRTYAKGEIVKYKNQYWSAATIVQPTTKFNYNDWNQSDYTRIQRGLLPNLANKADQLANSYNINSANLESDNDLLSYGLIGFRPRQYFTSLNLDDVSQLNVYRQFIESKGTILSADLLGRANLGKEAADYTIYENWAIQRATYGATANRNFVDLRLNREYLTSDPVIVQIVEPDQSSEADQAILVQNIWKSSFPVRSAEVFPTTNTEVTDVALPNAGYVNLNEIDIPVFELTDPTALRANFDKIQNGTKIWVAKINNYDWGIYRAKSVKGVIEHVCDNLNGTCRVIFSLPHEIVVGSTLIIKFFDPEVNGVYKVLSTPDILTANIEFSFTAGRTVANGSGIGFVLQSMRVAQASDIAALPYSKEILPGAMTWVDNFGNNQWAVLEKTNPFVSRSIIEPSVTYSGLNYGASVSQAISQTALFVGAPGYVSGSAQVGALFVYFKSFTGQYAPLSGQTESEQVMYLSTTGVRGLGNSVEIGRQYWGAAGASASLGPNGEANNGYCAVINLDTEVPNSTSNPYTVWQLLTMPGTTTTTTPGAGEFGYSVTMSGDERWLYVGAPGLNKVYAYARVPVPVQKFVAEYTSAVDSVDISSTIQITNQNQITVEVDNRALTLGVDYTVSGLTTVEFADPVPANTKIVVTRNIVHSFLGGYISYNVGNYLYGINNVDACTVYVDGVIKRPRIDYNIVSGVLTFKTATAPGSNVYISARSHFQYVTELVANDTFEVGSRFGHSVQCKNDGRQVIVGARNKIVEGQDQAGAVYIFDRNVQRFVASVAGTATTYTVIGSITNPVSVLLNGEFLLNQEQGVVGADGTFAVNGNIITVHATVSVGDTIEIETNQFVQQQKIVKQTKNSAGTIVNNVTEHTNFGQALELCTYNCSLYVGAPQDSDSAWKAGSVQRNVAQARTYGTITATVANPVLTAGQRLRVNNVDVVVPAAPNNTVTGLAAVINGHQTGGSPNVPNASATVSADGYLTIFATNNSVAVGTKLEVAPGSGTTTVYQALGFQEFVYTQTIESPLPSDFAAFGASLAVNDDSTTLAVGSPSAALYLPNTFDYSATLEKPTTTFDGNSTMFYAPVPQSGSVYTFDYFPSATSSVDVPGQFVFGQQIANNRVHPNDLYGTSVNYTAGVLVGGAPGHAPTVLAGHLVSGTTYTIMTLGTTDFTTVGAYVNKVGITFVATGVGTGTGTAYSAGWGMGSIFAYENPNRIPAWKVIHNQQPVVDVHLLNSVFMYDRVTGARSEFFDYIDPMQGKILGAAQQNLDYIGAVDPAEYNVGYLNNNGNFWAATHVGEMWWDISTVRFINPNQNSIVYAARRWSQVFPGSTVDVYQWVESSVAPANYTGPGTPRNDTSYVINTQLNQNGIFITKYYFWVKGITSVMMSNAKTLSAQTVANYIESPKSSGISYIAAINSSTIAIYNGLQYINAADTIISVEFDFELNEANIHTEYELITQDLASAFLSDSLYRKWLDSFCGVDTFGNKVPDAKLPASQQIGVQVRPRQTMFANRYLALKNYITRANNIFTLYPISETRNFPLLYSQEAVPPASELIDGDTIVNWNFEVANLEILGYQDIYSVPLGYKYLVDTDSDNSGLWTIYTVKLAQGSLYSRVLQLSRVQNYKTSRYWSFVNWYAPGYNSSAKISFEVSNYSNLALLPATVGTSAKVTANPQGKFEIYLLTNTGWERVGLQDGTIEISAEIYDYNLGRFGFDAEVFDAQYFDQEPVIETRKILQSINEELFIDELLIERNRSLTMTFDFILSETAAPEWLTKTSLIDVTHSIRELIPFPNYQTDNQTFVLDYLTEVKPYHVQIREFNLKYYGLDEFSGSMTDFDVPAYFDSALDIPQYISPILLPYEHSSNQLFNTLSDAAASDVVWTEWPYNQWFSHYLLTVEKVKLFSGGVGYTQIPTINIVGDCEVQATAEAVINSLGQVVAINVTNPGAGYRNTPTVEIISAEGSGAVAYPVMVNRSASDFGEYVYNTNSPVSVAQWEFETGTDVNLTTVRSIKTVIKFDRNQYKSGIVEWSATSTYTMGDRVRYVNQVWEAVENNGPESLFNLAQWQTVPAGELSGIDRTMGYYVPGINMPGLELPLLMDGIDYPGVQVYGHDFDYVDPLDTIYESFWGPGTLIPTGTGPTDIDVQGGNFVGYYEGHAPEELVNGAEYDTVDFRVYTRPGSDWERNGHGFEVESVRYEAEDVGTPTTWSWADLVQYPVGLTVTNMTTAYQLVPEVDYTVNWENQTITVTDNLQIEETIEIDVYEPGGGSQLYRGLFKGNELGSTMILPFNSRDAAAVVFFVNGVAYNSSYWRPFYEPSTPWSFNNTYKFNDVVYNNRYVYYRAIKDVPLGISLNNTEYWQSSSYSIVGQLQFTGSWRNTLVSVPVVTTSSDLVVVVVMGNTAYPQKSWSAPVTQYTVVDETIESTRAVFLENYVGGTNPANLVVTRNGLRLNPAAGIEWFGDNVTTRFYLPQRMGINFSQQSIIAPTDVKVWLDNKLQTQGIDYYVTDYVGQNNRQVVFAVTPLDGSHILISVDTLADYRVYTSGFAPYLQFNFTPDIGDVISITSYNDIAEQDIVTLVFNGPTLVDNPTPVYVNNFDLRRLGLSGNRMWVTLDGRRLFDGVDFDIHGTQLILAVGTIGLNQTLVVTEYTTSVVPDPMAFRIFQDMRGVQATYRMTAASSTELAEDLLPNATEMRVVNAYKLPVPSISVDSNLYGIVTVDGERILYKTIDFVTNTVGGLLRGTAGTTTGSIMTSTPTPQIHVAGTAVYDMGRGNIMPTIFQDYVDQETFTADGVQTVFVSTALNIDTATFDFANPNDKNRVAEVYVSGQRVFTGFVAEVDQNRVTITFDTAPAAGRLITLTVRHGVTWYQHGVGTPSNGVALQDTNTPAARFLCGF